MCNSTLNSQLSTTNPSVFLRKHLPYPRYRAAEEDIATHCRKKYKADFSHRLFSLCKLSNLLCTVGIIKSECAASTEHSLLLY